MCPLASKAMFNFQPIKSPLARRLIVFTILFSTVITLLITILQLYRNYNSDIKLISTELDQIEFVHLNSISEALWTANRKLLKTNINGIIKIRDMQYVEIRDDKEIWVKAGKKTDDNIIQRTYPINYKHRNKIINIGTLTAIVSLNGVYQRLYDEVLVILVSNAIKTSLVALFIYFLFYFLITRHLEKISAYTKTQNLLLNEATLSLDRHNNTPDEFDTLVNAINFMRMNLRQQIKSVHKQRQHLSQTLDSIGDAVITTNTLGNITRMNPVAEKLTGWTISEAHGRPVKDIFTLYDDKKNIPVPTPEETVITKGETLNRSNHCTLVAKDGTKYHISNSAAPIKSGEQILGMVLTFSDVTEQYKLRQAVEISEKKYQILETVSPVGIFYTDPQGQYLYVNEKWCEIAGISAEQAAGDGWTQALYPDDREYVFAQWQKLATESTPFKCEYRFITADKITWVLGQAQVNKDSHGKVVGYVGSITDITERKDAEAAVRHSEQQLAEAQHMSHIGSWELDLKSNELQWSDEVYRIFEINPDEVSASYETFINTIHPDDREKVNNEYKSSVENKKSYTVTHRLRMPDGRIKYVEERCKTFYDDDGLPVRSRGTIQDISQQVQLEETLRRSQKMDALGKLTSGIAHDYNNMLGVILGYADLLKHHLAAQPKLAEYANEIHRAGKRGSKLTKKILSFARNNQGECKTININNLLKDEKNMLKKSLTTRIKLEYDLLDDLWPISINKDELEDTIFNICINAMHAIEGNGTLTIKTRNDKIDINDTPLIKVEPGEYVSVSFIDTGIGMDSETQQKMFDPFYTTKGQVGTGLGLSQVYGFVQRSNGTIKVHSEPGQGSCFILYFKKSHLVANTERIKTEEKPSKSNCDATLLLVDDEKSILKLAKNILETAGYKVLTANDGRQAMKVLKQEPIDILITDVIMPNMDGYQLAAYAKKNYPNIKIQMVSGYADNQHNIQTVKNLEKNILFKPYTRNSLLTRVDNLLSTPTKNKTILLVDDDNDILDLFELNLGKLGYQTISSNTGEKAVELYQQSIENNTPISAAIIDLSLHGKLNGKDVAKTIRELNPNAKLIVSSGNSTSEEMTNCQKYGFDAALEKDFNRENMKQVLDKLLETKEASLS